MEIADILIPEGVLPHLKATSKKQALQEISRRAADVTGLEHREIFDVLRERERLGSTGMGNGIAIPHGKLPRLDRLCAVFARADRAVDFDAIDDKPVDIIFLLLAPEAAGADHLKALARISRLLRDKSVCEKMRGADSVDVIYALLTEATASNAA